MKKVLLPLLAVAIVGVVGCQKEGCTDSTANNYDEEAKKDDGTCTYDPEAITFLEPTDEEEIPYAERADVHIHIDFFAKDELHDVFVELHEEGNTTPVFEYENHVHAATFSYDEPVNLEAYAAGTEFHLEAKVCYDHDCNEMVEKEIHFKLGPQ